MSKNNDCWIRSGRLLQKEWLEKSMGMAKEFVENDCEGYVEFGEEENVVCENECHVVLEDTCLNQDCYNNNE